MIKTGIWGAETEASGELIRILLLHPEVEDITAVSESEYGKPICSRHYGLIGEKDIKFVKDLDLKDIDVLFVMNGNFPQVALNGMEDSSLRIISLKREFFPSPEKFEVVTGLSEIFRKNLVRGARHAHLLTPVVSLSLIALFPIAKNLLLNDTLEIRLDADSKYSSDETLQEADKWIGEILGAIQQSFNKKIEIVRSDEKTAGMFKVDINLKCGVSLPEIEKLYENIYDDHNFTFLYDGELAMKEVRGTQKCLIRLSKPDEETLNIQAIADPTMRGNAGDAVHVMNLLFGLYEKIGLSFRAFN